MTKLIVAFRNFTKAPKTPSVRKNIDVNTSDIP
jgi:hypothetical protein